VIHTKYLNSLKVVYGKLEFRSDSHQIFDNNIINFVNTISKEIFKNKNFRKYSDLIFFAFWCRKSNLIKISKKYKSEELILGRGTVFHVPPSNVPINFAYSLIFGLLSGNNNIIRLPSKNFDQVNILLKIIFKILRNKRFSNLKKRLCFIKYDRSKEISSQISKFVNARLIWGGDETIKEFKNYETTTRCVDLLFPNRYSIAVINGDKIKNFNHSKIDQLANNFFSDSYIMDQQGCSSPHAVFWVGKQKSKLRNIFWKKLSILTNKKYEDDISVANKKLSLIMNNILKSKFDYKLKYKEFNLTILKSKRLNKDLEKIQLGYGNFFETNIQSLNKLKSIITNKYQTMLFYGYDKDELKKFLIKNKLNGIDRIVPIGRAFDMGPTWDGYDIIRTLSRTIAE